MGQHKKHLDDREQNVIEKIGYCVGNQDWDVVEFISENIPRS